MSDSNMAIPYALGQLRWHVVEIEGSYAIRKWFFGFTYRDLVHKGHTWRNGDYMDDCFSKNKELVVSLFKKIHGRAPDVYKI